MSNWMPDVTLEPIDFDGDSVVLRVQRLKTDDMHVVLQNYDRATGKLSFGSPEEMSELAARLVPKYVLGMDGLKKQDGTPMTLPEFVAAAGEYYFSTLVGALFVQLMGVSVVKVDDAKNSVAPPPVQQAASGAETPAT
jgi:hypothetical protein